MSSHLCAHRLLTVLTLAHVVGNVCGDEIFYFDYTHHGEDWILGECASRDRQSPIDFDSHAPWSCNPPLDTYLRHTLGPQQFNKLFPNGIGNAEPAGAAIVASGTAGPAPGIVGFAPAPALLQLNVTQGSSQYPMMPFAPMMPMTTMNPYMAHTPPPSVDMLLSMMTPPPPGYQYTPMAAYYRTLMQLKAMNPPTPPPMFINGCGPGLGTFYYKYDKVEKPLTILNNGHGLSLDLQGHGIGSITQDGYIFDVLSINFHAHGEHQFNGNVYPLELHIVHREAETQQILVVAVPFKAPASCKQCHVKTLRKESLSGSAASLLEQSERKESRRFLGPKPPPQLVDPLKETEVVPVQDIVEAARLPPIEAAELLPPNSDSLVEPVPSHAGHSEILDNLYVFPLPKQGQTKEVKLKRGPINMLEPLLGGPPGSTPQGFFQYRGSLTAPPCSEQVTWLVRKEPLQASAHQLEMFRVVIAEVNSNFANARSVMPLMGREILYKLGLNGEPPLPPQAPNDPVYSPPEDIYVDFHGVATGKDALKSAMETKQAKDLIASAIVEAQSARSMAITAVDPFVGMKALHMPMTAGGQMFTTPLPTPNPERILSRIADTVAEQLDGPEKQSALAAAGIAFAPNAFVPVAGVPVNPVMNPAGAQWSPMQPMR